MRILTIIDHLGPGGRQRTAQNYTVGYQEAGCDVAVLSLIGSGPRHAELESHGVPVFIGGSSDHAQDKAARAAAAWHPDVIHLHSEGPVRDFEARTVEALVAASEKHLPILETTSFGKVDYSQRYTETDVHLLMTRWAFWRWQQWSRPIRPRPLGVIVPITADPSTFYPAPDTDTARLRERLGIPSNAVVFGCVARPDPLKWPAVMFHAFEAVAAVHPHVYFVAAGLADEARPRLEALPSSIRDRFVELDFIRSDHDLRTLYSTMDAFLHGSPIGESFGLVFVEALLCGTPIITTNTPAKNNSQLEVVGHMRGGLIANDEAGMISAMHQFVRDAPLRHSLAEQGAKHVRSHFTLDHVVPTLLRIARIACDTPDRTEMAAKLRAEPSLTTDVARSDIEKLLANTIGRTSRIQKAKMRLIHTPALARLWWKIKPPSSDPRTS